MKLFIKDDAVSESLGFILLAFILTMAISIVLMIGYPIYQNTITQAHMQNMEEGFLLLSANANKVALYDSPIQSSELKLYGGSLWLRNDGYFNITYTTETGLRDNYNYTIQVIEYALNDKSIAYIMGATCEKTGSTSIMMSEPAMYKNDTTGSNYTMVIPIINYQNDMGALAGTGLARLTISSPYYAKMVGTLSYPPATHVEHVKEIYITMKSSYSDCFCRYFQDRFGFTVVSSTGGELTMMHTYEDPGITLYIIPCQLSVEVN